VAREGDFLVSDHAKLAVATGAAAADTRRYFK
jgi:hypothetical protein